MSAPYREDLGDLKKLPAELRKELAFAGVRASKRQQQVLDAIDDHGGRASLNEILVGVWRASGDVLKRGNLTAVCAKMVQKKLLWRIEGEIPVYSTSDPAAGKAQPAPVGKPAAAAKPATGRRRAERPMFQDVDPPPLDADLQKKAAKAYDLRKDGKMDFGEIAVTLGGGMTADRVRFIAMQYAKENGKPWPV